MNTSSSDSPERSRRASRAKRASAISVAIWLFVALWGGIVLVAGLQSGVSSWRFASRAVRTEGTVVRHDNRIPGEGTSNKSCRAVVVYDVADRSYVVFGPGRSQPRAKGWPKVSPIGSRVRVLYDPDRLESALVESFEQQWAECTVFGGVGLALVLLGVWQAWSRCRTRIGNVWVQAGPNQSLNPIGNRPAS